MEQKVSLVFFVNLKCWFQIRERKGAVLSSYLPASIVTQKVDCIASVSARVRRESWDESKKKRNEGGDYSDASFTVNSCSVTINPLTVPCFVLFFVWDFRERQQSLRGLGHWEDRIIILLRTKIIDFPTFPSVKSLLFYPLKPEKVPLSGGASPYRLLKGKAPPDFSNRVASDASLSAKVVNLVLSQTLSAYKFTCKKNTKQNKKKTAETGETGGQFNKTSASVAIVFGP